MVLFEGYHGAHGTHGATERSASKGGKQEIKKSARTVREPVTVELWDQHLRGERPLGVIPIREDNTCLWGVIDVDQYDINHGSLVKELRKRRLPLVLTKSKSGGAHAFLFLNEPVPAEDLRSRLRQISASMGWGDSEIFPKQNQLLADRGDLGNWLNMPYLGGDKTSRFAVKETGSGMTLHEFLRYAEEHRVRLEDVEEPADTVDESLNDGPPCLQHLADVGFPDGTRNNGLFGLAVFCKKKFGERWKEMLEQYNREYMKPPLESREVNELIQRLERKDYQYKCKDAPCVNYCNSALCKTRKFGVGGGGRIPTITGVVKLGTGEDTLWFLDVDDHRIMLNTHQLQNYREFQKIAMEQLTIFYMPLSAVTWASIVGDAMAQAQYTEVAPEATAQGQFMELLEEFLVDRHRGEKVEDLRLGKPWYDENSKKFYFRLRDLMSHLEKAKFGWGRNVVGRKLEELGGRHFFNVKGNGINTYWMPDNFSKKPEVELPPSRVVPV